MITRRYNAGLIGSVITNEDLNELLRQPLVELNIPFDPDDSVDDMKLIKESRCQFTQNQNDPETYELSLLGLINGILPELTNKVLVQTLDDDGEVTGYDIVDKWW